MTTTVIPQALPVAKQPTLSDKVWDILLKLSVTVAIALVGWAVTVETRLTKAEGAIVQTAKDITRLESLNTDLLRKMDQIIDALNVIGNRITRIETKIEQR